RQCEKMDGRTHAKALRKGRRPRAQDGALRPPRTIARGARRRPCGGGSSRRVGEAFSRGYAGMLRGGGGGGTANARASGGPGGAVVVIGAQKAWRSSAGGDWRAT